MRIYSGQCEHGLCGTPTRFTDCDGKRLRVGDIVVSFTVDEFGVNNFNLLTVVVEDRPKLVGRTEDTGPFVMGIASVDFMDEDSPWSVRLLKRYEDVVAGEHWKEWGFNYRDEQ